MPKKLTPDHFKKYRRELAESCIDNSETVESDDGEVKYLLEDHQAQAMEEVVYALAKEKKDRFSVVHSGGSGKTVLEAAMVQASQKAKDKLDDGLEDTQDIVLAVERSLMGSIRDHIAALGIDVGMWGSGQRVTDRPVLVTSIQSLQHNKNSIHKIIDPANIALILGDEADKFLTGSRQKILQVFRNATRIGFTATPEWPDGRHIQDAWGEVVHHLSLREGIRTEVNIAPMYTLYETDFNTDDLKLTAGDFEKKSLESAMKAVEIELAIPQVYEQIVPEGQHKEWPTLIYVPSIATVRRVTKKMRETFPHLSVVGWTGSIANGKLNREIKSFRKGEIDVIVLCEMGGRGLNLPRARVLIDAYPTLSANKLEQRHCRALRKIRKGTFHKPFSHIAQIMPKSNTFRPITLLDVLDCWPDWRPGRVLGLGRRSGGSGEGDGPAIQEEVNAIVENMKKHPLTSNVTLVEYADVLQEIKLRDELPMADAEGFVYLDEETGDFISKEEHDEKYPRE